MRPRQLLLPGLLMRLDLLPLGMVISTCDTHYRCDSGASQQQEKIEGKDGQVPILAFGAGDESRGRGRSLLSIAKVP